MAFSITAVATIVAPVLGPVLGGWITDNYTWRWIFFINIPVATFTFFAVSALVEDPPWVANQPKRSVDGIGLGLIALGLGCLQVVMDRGEDDDWFGSSFLIVGMTIAAAVGPAGRDRLAADGQEADREPARDGGPQFLPRLPVHLRYVRCAVCVGRPDPAVGAGGIEL